MDSATSTRHPAAANVLDARGRANKGPGQDQSQDKNVDVGKRMDGHSTVAAKDKGLKNSKTNAVLGKVPGKRKRITASNSETDAPDDITRQPIAISRNKASTHARSVENNEPRPRTGRSRSTRAQSIAQVSNTCTAAEGKRTTNQFRD